MKSTFNEPYKTKNLGPFFHLIFFSENRSAARKGGEDKIELAFRAKRANIFTQGVDLGQEARDSRAQKRVPKSQQQAAKICI